ncbi:MAG: polysaccharide deacetylase family protein [Lachnospiraceae bacterium]|jgi:polysaccharide deacetylase family sporulation protein PdaB|nr:polysaccharide deacetylase family protein [Lachnospiraceae bacterium]
MNKYIKKVKQMFSIFPPRQEGQSGEEYARQKLITGVKYGVFLLTAFALLRGILVTAGANITVSSSVDGRELPIYCVETPEKKIALSFDAAWGNEDTGKILEILQKQDVHVTFFMTGGWVESYPDDVKAILAAGHDLGNHSENHKNMSQLSDQEKKDELMKVHTKVQELTGYEMFLFRPPYGDYDNAVVNVAKDCGYYTIQWDVDSLDWKDYGVDSIIKTVTQHKHLGNGSIVLCHNGAKYTAEALDTLIATLKNEGYTFVPISELIYKDNYHMNHEGRQIKN